MICLQWDERLYREESAALRLIGDDGCTLIIGTDFSNPGQAISALVEAHRLGRLTALYPVMPDPAEQLVAQIGVQISKEPDLGQRYEQALALAEDRLSVNGKPVSQSASYAAQTLNAARLAAKLADVLLFFSIGEKQRWEAIVGRPVRRFAYLPVPKLRGTHANAPGIIVYAPEAREESAALIGLALGDRRSAALNFASNAPGEIAVDTVIVPAWWRPARGACFAAAGYRVVTPATAMPDDRFHCATYRPTNVFSLAAAVDASESALRGLRFDVEAEQTRAVITSSAPPTTPGPRVSIIVRTFNRPGLLPRAIRSITAQTYDDIEIVVVNNGGEDVEPIVPASCGARRCRYVKLEERSHISTASNAGARAATGFFVGYLDDDDLLYPDHVARSVAALLHSGADIAYTNCLAEYAVMNGLEKRVVGYQMFRDRDFVPQELFRENVTPIHSVVHRRDLFERIGYFDERYSVHDDWELWARACSLGARFVHVDHVTAEYSWRYDPERGNMTLTHQRDFFESYSDITARYADQVASMPSILQGQEQTQSVLKQRAEIPAERLTELSQTLFRDMARTAVPVETPPADPFQ